MLYTKDDRILLKPLEFAQLIKSSRSYVDVIISRAEFSKYFDKRHIIINKDFISDLKRFLETLNNVKSHKVINILNQLEV